MSDEGLRKIFESSSKELVVLRDKMNLDQKKFVLSLMLMDSDLINSLTNDEYDDILIGIVTLRMLGSLEQESIYVVIVFYYYNNFLFSFQLFVLQNFRSRKGY